MTGMTQEVGKVCNARLGPSWNPSEKESQGKGETTGKKKKKKKKRERAKRGSLLFCIHLWSTKKGRGCFPRLTGRGEEIVGEPGKLGGDASPVSSAAQKVEEGGKDVALPRRGGQRETVDWNQYRNLQRGEEKT